MIRRALRHPVAAARHEALPRFHPQPAELLLCGGEGSQASLVWGPPRRGSTRARPLRGGEPPRRAPGRCPWTDLHEPDELHMQSRRLRRHARGDELVGSLMLRLRLRSLQGGGAARAVGLQDLDLDLDLRWGRPPPAGPPPPPPSPPPTAAAPPPPPPRPAPPAPHAPPASPPLPACVGTPPPGRPSRPAPPAAAAPPPAAAPAAFRAAPPHGWRRRRRRRQRRGPPVREEGGTGRGGRQGSGFPAIASGLRVQP